MTVFRHFYDGLKLIKISVRSLSRLNKSHVICYIGGIENTDMSCVAPSNLTEMTDPDLTESKILQKEAQFAVS